MIVFLVGLNCQAIETDVDELRKEFESCRQQNRFNIEECEALFREILKKELSTFQLRRMYSVIISNSLNTGDYQRAKDFALELQGKSKMYEENNLLSISNKFLGHSESRLGNHKKAIQHYRNALEYNNDTLDVHHKYVTRLCLVYNLVHSERIGEAKELYEQYWHQYSELENEKAKHAHIAILFLIAESDILNAENKSDEALQKLIKAQSLFGQNAPILLHESLYHRLIYTQSRRGEYHEVIKASIDYKELLSNNYWHDYPGARKSEKNDAYNSKVVFLLVFLGGMFGVAIGFVFRKRSINREMRRQPTPQEVKAIKVQHSKEPVSSKLTPEQKRDAYHQIISSIREGQEWHTIYLDYCRLYPNICERLDTVFNGITGVNKVIVCCIRLGLSNPDISEYLNLSPRSVESRKYRLAKRYGIRDQKSLKEILTTL